MLFPLLKDDYEQSHPEIEWSGNQQGVRNLYWLHNAALATSAKKVSSGDVMGWLGQTAHSSSASQSMRFTGGYVEYTVLNSCNHTVEVTVTTMKPKRRHSQGVFECWQKDLLSDNTVADGILPVNIERTMDTYGTPLFEANNPKSYMTFNWTKLRETRKVLAVGETFTYRVNSKPFIYDEGRENMFQDAAIGGEPFVYSPNCRVTHFTCRSQVVVNTAGNSVAHGSGKVAICEKSVGYMRGFFRQKKFQTVNHGGLDTIADLDQSHYNVDTEAANIFDET